MKDIPKIELHLHLEGGAPPAFIRTLAAEKGLDLSEIFNPDGSYAYRDFLHFLSVYEAACTTLTGPEEFYRLTRAVLAESAANGVVYSETFLSPDFCGGGDLGAWRDYLAAIRQAALRISDIVERISETEDVQESIALNTYARAELVRLVAARIRLQAARTRVLSAEELALASARMAEGAFMEFTIREID